ncbi:MAG: hypothetical protein ABL949_09525 [Fimbriimonadaceae bacterium]
MARRTRSLLKAAAVVVVDRVASLKRMCHGKSWPVLPLLIFACSGFVWQQKPGAKVYKSPPSVRGSTLANQKWVITADAPFAKFREEQNELWKRYRNGDPKKELSARYRAALAAWKGEPTPQNLYRAFSMAFLSRFLAHRNSIGSEIENEWVAFAKLGSLEAARVYYLYTGSILLDDTFISKIALSALQRDPEDEAMQLKMCKDTYFDRTLHAPAAKVALANTGKAFSDPHWASAVAIALFWSWKKDLPYAEDRIVIAYQAMLRFEKLVPGGKAAFGSASLRSSLLKHFPQFGDIATRPWKFGPLKGQRVSR